MNEGTPSYIGKVLVDGKLSGTGFVIHAEGRLVATARHVIGTTDVAKLRFQLFNTSEQLCVNRIVAERPEELEDIALLELTDPLPASVTVPDLVVNVPAAATPFVVTGYDQEYDQKQKKFEYRSATGTVSGSTGKVGISYSQLTTSHIWKGMSGAPILVPEGESSLLLYT